MSTAVILDTGPLVAWLNRTDQWHTWAVEQFSRLEPPLICSEPMLTEACFLYFRGGGKPATILINVHSGKLRIGMEIQREAGAVQTLMARYADAPMSLADACAVRLSEIHRDCRVFTLDRHFQRYRRYGRSVIPLLAPF